jgi:hypothetical protein
MSYTPHQVRFFAEQLMLQRPQDSIEGLASSMSGVKVDLIADIDLRNQQLKHRLQNFCKRTLRHQVREYVPYTDRIAILQEYTPSQAEEELYNSVSEYL